METDTEKTKVIFRQWKIGCAIIAYFPEIASDNIGDFCQSYMHYGQHSSANPETVADTKPANLNDGAVKRLIKELTELGYNLEIIKRFRYAHQLTRMEKVKEVNLKAKDMKVCPFCKSDALAGKHQHRKGMYIVRCGSSGEHCPFFPSSGPIEKKDLAHHIDKWNNR